MDSRRQLKTINENVQLISKSSCKLFIHKYRLRKLLSISHILWALMDANLVTSKQSYEPPLGYVETNLWRLATTKMKYVFVKKNIVINQTHGLKGTI